KKPPIGAGGRYAPPHTIWGLCPNKNGDSYKTQEASGSASRHHSLLGFWLVLMQMTTAIFKIRNELGLS
ncbi:MAG: hypothetical protein ACK5C4_19750, partial [Pseudanabaena sp.]